MRAAPLREGQDPAIHLAGFTPLSLSDFPGKLAAVAFTQGCPWRCGFCHNAPLMAFPDQRSPNAQNTVFTELMAYLHEARLVEGVVVSGGEPTWQPGLERLLRAIRGLGLATKLDTNGMRPNVLGDLLRKGLLDYVAMDVKAPPEKYAQVVRRPVDLEALKASVALLKGSGVRAEFRTTLVPGLLEEDDLVAIGQWVNGAERWALQTFEPKHANAKALRKRGAWDEDTTRRLAERCRSYAKEVIVR